MQSVENQTNYITQKTAADLLMVSTGTIRNLIKKKELEAFKFGSQIRITECSIKSYIEKNRL